MVGYRVEVLFGSNRPHQAAGACRVGEPRGLFRLRVLGPGRWTVRAINLSWPGNGEIGGPRPITRLREKVPIGARGKSLATEQSDDGQTPAGQPLSSPSLMGIRVRFDLQRCLASHPRNETSLGAWPALQRVLVRNLAHPQAADRLAVQRQGLRDGAEDLPLELKRHRIQRGSAFYQSHIVRDYR